MKRSITLVVLWLAIALLAAPVQAKGDVDRITIAGPGLKNPILLTKERTPEMNVLNPWFAGYLDGFVETAPKGPIYTVDFYMNISSGETADLRHIYRAQYVPDPAGGAGYFYIPGSGDEGYGLNKGTIMAAERDGMWHRASDRWEEAVGPGLHAAGITPGTVAAPGSPPLPEALILTVLLLATVAAAAISRRGRRQRFPASRLKTEAD